MEELPFLVSSFSGFRNFISGSDGFLWGVENGGASPLLYPTPYGRLFSSVCP